MPAQVVGLSPQCNLAVVIRKIIGLLDEAVHQDNLTSYDEEPQHTADILAPSPDLKQPIADRLGQRFAMVRAVSKQLKSGKRDSV